VIKDLPRQDPTRIDVFDDQPATITYHLSSDAYQTAPFQFFAAGHRGFSTYSGSRSSRRSIDAIRTENVERFKAEVEHILPKSAFVLAESSDDELGAENESVVVVAAIPVPRGAPPSNARYLARSRSVAR
jgi:hypothetical protein